jgi:hypothetical protein
MAQLTAKGQTAMQNGQQTYQSKAKALSAAETELAGEKMRLANLQDFLAAKYAAAGNSTTDAKTLGKAFQFFLREKGQAEVLLTCQQCKSAGDKPAQCQAALGLLERVLPEDDPQLAIAKASSTDPGTSGTPGPARAPADTPSIAPSARP